MNMILAPNGAIGVIEKVLFESAGNLQVPTLNISLHDFRRMVYDISERLLGKAVKSTGSIVQVNGKLCFIQKTLEGIC
ncbi:hypothetical protein KEJ43_00055 [Candidatus Bathyarchaeota archaeon]|nr:hypothetical protein [Candidatus Bathyarchaeota archaeon]